MRSTFTVAELIEEVNRFNKESVKLSPDMRHGANVLLENMLHKAGAYAGFGYYRADELPETELAGVVWLSPEGKKLDRWQEGAVATFPDDSRRFYYLHGKLRDRAYRAANKLGRHQTKGGS